jgi:hypothetical protein
MIGRCHLWGNRVCDGIIHFGKVFIFTAIATATKKLMDN